MKPKNRVLQLWKHVLFVDVPPLCGKPRNPSPWGLPLGGGFNSLLSVACARLARLMRQAASVCLCRVRAADTHADKLAESRMLIKLQPLIPVGQRLAQHESQPLV